jgi:hypothetical protein
MVDQVNTNPNAQRFIDAREEAIKEREIYGFDAQQERVVIQRTLNLAFDNFQYYAPSESKALEIKATFENIFGVEGVGNGHAIMIDALARSNELPEEAQESYAKLQELVEIFQLGIAGGNTSMERLFHKYLESGVIIPIMPQFITSIGLVRTGIRVDVVCVGKNVENNGESIVTILSPENDTSIMRQRVISRDVDGNVQIRSTNQLTTSEIPGSLLLQVSGLIKDISMVNTKNPEEFNIVYKY